MADAPDSGSGGLRPVGVQIPPSAFCYLKEEKMLRIKNKILFFIFIFFLSFSLFGKSSYEYVNPFIGTGGFGHTFPGAVVPFGMVQVSPDTALKNVGKSYPWCAGYKYSDKTILGFSHTHFSGTGHSDLGDIMIMPTTGKLILEPGSENKPEEGYRSRFSHKKEFAEPGYYRVKLLDYDIDAELTVTKRVALHRYRFNSDKKAHIILDLIHSIYNYDGKVVWSYIRIVNNRLITGYRQTYGWAKNRKIFFAIEFSEPFSIYGYKRYDNENYYFRSKNKLIILNNKRESHEIYGKKIRAFFDFNLLDGKKILMVKVGISGVDMDGALKNLREEIPSWDFEKIRKKAKESWENLLNKIVVSDKKEREKEIFYTALYHLMIAPMLYEDVDGRYRGIDHKIHKAKQFTNYTTFSLWDTFRAAHPLFIILQRERVGDFINSMLAHYKQSPEQMLPIWPFHGNETWCMIGYHSAAVISEAYLKGIKKFNPDFALEAMIKTATNENYGGLKYYEHYGYIPVDKEIEAASKTLEYGYDDYAIALMAKKLGKNSVFKRFLKRSFFYKNIYDKKTGFMRAKLSNGKFREPFDPLKANYGGDYTEGNAWQYTWHVLQDPMGLIKLMGGRKRFSKKLDMLFKIKGDKEKYGSVEDMSGFIGQYVHGNEPSHHIAYLYNYAGMPYKTQEKIDLIMRTMFDNTPNGIPGNEDCGQMSAWYIFSALGFYPVSPVDGIYLIGKPLFGKVKINLSKGKTFTIIAKNLTKKNIYIKRAKLNGKDLKRSYITHQELMSGGVLEFIMDKKPNKKWASKKKYLPPSASTIFK